jgi:hypothetical protein
MSTAQSDKAEEEFANNSLDVLHNPFFSGK